MDVYHPFCVFVYYHLNEYIIITFLTYWFKVQEIINLIVRYLFIYNGMKMKSPCLADLVL